MKRGLYKGGNKVVTYIVTSIVGAIVQNAGRKSLNGQHLVKFSGHIYARLEFRPIPDLTFLKIKISVFKHEAMKENGMQMKS